MIYTVVVSARKGPQKPLLVFRVASDIIQPVRLGSLRETEKIQTFPIETLVLVL